MSRIICGVYNYRDIREVSVEIVEVCEVYERFVAFVGWCVERGARIICNVGNDFEVGNSEAGGPGEVISCCCCENKMDAWECA